MAVIKIHGHPFSTCTRMVACIANELDVPYELITVDLMKGEQKSPEHKKFQPFGIIPYINDNGFILYESRAICRYLVAKYGDKARVKLVPSYTDIEATALFEQAADIEAFNFDPYMIPLVVQRVFRKRFAGVAGDEAIAKPAETTLLSKLEAYEDILGRQKYLAGNDLTLADLFHLPFGYEAVHAGIDLGDSNKWPNIARWWKDITSRPAWQKVKDNA